MNPVSLCFIRTRKAQISLLSAPVTHFTSRAHFHDDTLNSAYAAFEVTLSYGHLRKGDSNNLLQFSMAPDCILVLISSSLPSDGWGSVLTWV